MTVTNETNPQQEQLSRRIESLRESDPQFRAAQPDPAVAEQVLRPGLHLSEAIAALMTGYAERPALGERARELVTDQDGRTTLRLLPRFDTTTYGELWSRTTSVAAAWHHDAAHPVKAGDLVATLGFTSIDYTVLDLAIMILGGVAVPLQTSAPASQWTTILAEAEPNTLAVSIELIGAAMESVRATPSIKQVVVFDYTPRSMINGRHSRQQAHNSPAPASPLRPSMPSSPAAPHFRRHRSTHHRPATIRWRYSSTPPAAPGLQRAPCTAKTSCDAGGFVRTSWPAPRTCP